MKLKEKVRNNVLDKVERRIWGQLGYKLSDQINNKVWGQVRGNVREKDDWKVLNGVYNQLLQNIKERRF
jgi:hypothetical protein